MATNGSIAESSATFALADQDHTLGNSVRFILNQDPRVSFCGYSVPHPSENSINIRVQTTGAPVRVVFREALVDLSAVCDHVNETFKSAVDRYKAEKGVENLNVR